MFVKKLIDKISRKPAAAAVPTRSGMGREDVNARLVFHYGIPAKSSTVAYDPINKILAISTIDGRIKLFGRNNTQHLLESDLPIPSKFLQFFGNQGILLNVTTENHIQVWNLSKKELVRTHIHQTEITAFTVVQQTPFMYIGDNLGSISVLKIESETCNLLPSMSCNIPFSESHGIRTEAAGGTAVLFVLPQPKSENKRILIIFEDGIINLWGIEETKSLYVIGGTTSQAIRVESKKVSASCWVCSYGTKVAVGYTTGDILIWTVPNVLDSKPEQIKSCSAQNTPLAKLNLGYKTEKIPIVSLRWVSSEGKDNRLYVNGVSDLGGYSSHLCQVILLNENMESRRIKFVLPLSEACRDIKIISTFSEQKKNANKILLLLLKSGEIWVYDESDIEKYLLQYQSNPPLWLPKHAHVKTPLGGSTAITVAIFATLKSDSSCSGDEEDSTFLSRKEHCIFSSNSRSGMLINSKQFSGFSKSDKLYITGHQDGAINFWDASCPLLISILSIKYQSEDEHSLNENPVRAMYFDINSHVLVAGYQNGLVNVFVFQKSDSAFSFLQVKQGCSYTTNGIELNGTVTSISMNSTSRRLAVGTNKGFVSVVEIEGMTVLYHKYFPSDTHQGITSMHFEQVFLNGSENNVLLIAAKDTSIYALDASTGLVLSTTPIRAKNQSVSLFMQTLDIEDQQLLLICSEKSIRLYFLLDAIQGIKKLHIKKKIPSACCWASTFCSPSSGYGLILVFTCGRIEIRSIPDLILLNETSVRNYDGVLCSSSDGELILAKGDQEISFISVLRRNSAYRILGSISRVYDDGARPRRMPSPSLMISDAENNMVIKLTKSSQSRETEDTMLDIDDIDLEDSKEKSKVRNFAIKLDKNIGKKITAIKGKLKNKYAMKTDESSVNKSDTKDDKVAGTIDEIKKRYGYPLSGEQEVPRQAEAKLHDNIKKLEGINQRTGELQNSAKTFSSMAKQLLRSVEDGKGNRDL